jgi:lipoyl-dependent peroxiredoxin
MPVVVSPPTAGVSGQWHIEADAKGVDTRFLDGKGTLLGFALAARVTAHKITLQKTCQPCWRESMELTFERRNDMTTKLDQVLYTAKVRTTGGRDGRAVSDDGLLDVTLSPPKALGGMGGATNPEQLFAAGYSACFMGALKHVAGMKKVVVPSDASIEASVDIGPIPQGFGIAVQMRISLPGLDRAVAQDLVNMAHQVCPYSNATRGNIVIDLALV